MLRVANSTPIVDFDSRLNSFLVKRESTIPSTSVFVHMKRVRRDSRLLYEKEKVTVSLAVLEVLSGI